ncbi:hypothetical protein G7062_06110 [Erysipelothrix sp. HDW6C]|uniref:G5 domain-containing protein n=1 Tax=Erysipelothrix sp. HDW6C TaxID=2714930 RepID=UPI00140E56C5|nr:G5 domain-containing protein [Erysipelothrix sp. HDW6C]QIK69890.1 hypothetical protein G7062_06110 [Erysipelothrix sp. HDW6C]
MTKRTLWICIITIMVLTLDFTVSGSVKGNVDKPNTVQALERDGTEDVSSKKSDKANVPVKNESGTPAVSHVKHAVEKRVEEKLIQETFAYETEYRDDETLAKGETRIVQAGVAGIVDVRYRDYYENNVFVGTEVVSREISEEAIPEILLVGTKEGVVEPAPTTGELDLTLAQNMFAQMNTERRNAGLQELQWSSTLYEYAIIRAREIAIKFAHERPDGSSWDSINPDLIYAENLATRAFSVDAAMQGFMESPTHHANVLSPFPMGAVAVFKHSNGEWFWVQLYGY